MKKKKPATGNGIILILAGPCLLKAAGLRAGYSCLAGTAVLIFCLSLCSCMAALTPYNAVVRLKGEKSLTHRLAASRALIAGRQKQSAGYSLGEKAAIFEAQRDYFRLPQPFDSLSARQLRPGQPPAHGSFSFTSERLAMLAFKYQATADQQIKPEIRAILEAVCRIDGLFGKPGQLPRNLIVTRQPFSGLHASDRKYLFLERRGDSFVYAEGDAHGNTFPNHFFGLFAVYTLVDDPAIKLKAAEMVRHFISYLFEEGFVLKRLDGTPATYGGLTGREYFGLSKNALLARLTILEVSRFILHDRNPGQYKTLIVAIDQELRALRRRGTIQTIQKMPFHLGNITFSRPSSDRRVFLNLYLLASLEVLAGGSGDYAEAFENYWDYKKKGYNPFFTFLYFSLQHPAGWTFDDRLVMALTMEYLKSFPLDRDDREVLNSFFSDDEIEIDRFPVITKAGLIPMNKRPLPIYRRGVRRHEWRGNPFRLNGNLNRSGKPQAHPLDFLLVYYMGWAFDFIAAGDRIVAPAKVAGYLETMPLVSLFKNN